MKILLINPPQIHMFSRGQPKYYYEEQASLPPLPLLALATSLRDKSNHKFEILDAENLGLDHEQVNRELENRSYDIVGITCLSNTLVDAVKTARAVKKIAPDVPVIFGGYHPTLYPNETVGLTCVDYVCLGAGDNTLIELLDALENGDRRPSIQNIIFEPIASGIFGDRTIIIKDYTDIPNPDRSLLPINRYYSAITKNPPGTVMMSSTGCGFHCTFCNTDKPVYAKSVKKTIDEMEHCERLGIREIMFQDELFNFSRKRTIDLCQEIRDRGLTIPWSIKTRIDTVNHKTMELMRDANLYSIHFGIESGSQKILSVMRKGYTLERIRKTIAEAVSLGLSVTSSWMIGYIDETEEDVKKTIEFASSLGIDYAQFSITQPLPFTILYEEGMKRGLYQTDYWREFAATADPGFQPPFWNENLSDEDLLRLLNLAYKKFYLNKSYIMRRLRSIASVHQLMKNAKIGLRMALGV